MAIFKNQYGDTLVFRCPYCGIFRSTKISRENPCDCDIVDSSSGTERHYVNQVQNETFVIEVGEESEVIKAAEAAHDKLQQMCAPRERKNWSY